MSNLNNITSNTQDWTVASLVSFSKYMANAFCPGITQRSAGGGSGCCFEQAEDESIDENDNWTTESLIRMSESLARAYCPGL